MTKTELKKLEEALPKIMDDLFSSGVKILTRSDIEQIFSENRESWGLNKKTSVKSFIDFMGAMGLREAKFNFPSRRETRYLWGDVSAFELAQSLKPNAYLTHRGAMCIHGLTTDPPDLIYLNQEQSKSHQRNSNYANAGGYRSSVQEQAETFKRGRRARRAHGVHRAWSEDRGGGSHRSRRGGGESLRVTDVERTLVDITVRPAYAGGASVVLEAYRRAKGKVSVSRLVEILREMDYVYPFHQAVAFYLDRVGVYEDSELGQLQAIPMEFDFYLENRIDEPDYSERWRLYYPKGL